MTQLRKRFQNGETSHHYWPAVLFIVGILLCFLSQGTADEARSHTIREIVGLEKWKPTVFRAYGRINLRNDELGYFRAEIPIDEQAEHVEKLYISKWKFDAKIEKGAPFASAVFCKLQLADENRRVDLVFVSTRILCVVVDGEKRWFGAEDVDAANHFYTWVAEAIHQNAKGWQHVRQPTEDGWYFNGFR